MRSEFNKIGKLFMWEIKKILNEVNKVGYIFLKYSKENKQQMQSGRWHIKYRGKLIWVCNHENGKKCLDLIKNSSVSNLSNKEKIKKILKETIGKRYRYKVSNRNIDNCPLIDCIMYSATGKFFFYYWNEKIVKKEISEQELHQYELLKKMKYWRTFNSPVITLSEKGKYVIEKLIITQCLSKKEKEKYSYVLMCYRQYILSSVEYRTVEFAELLKEYFVELPGIDRIFTQEIKKKKINMYYMHGDMWTDNVLQDEDGKYYVIDYDHVGIYPFFFDILEYIWAIYINEGNLLFWNELNDVKENIAQTFDEILLQQGFATNYQTKFAIMVLMGMIRFHIYNERFQESDGSENKSYKYRHYELLVKFIQKYAEFSK